MRYYSTEDSILYNQSAMQKEFAELLKTGALSLGAFTGVIFINRMLGNFEQGLTTNPWHQKYGQQLKDFYKQHNITLGENLARKRGTSFFEGLKEDFRFYRTRYRAPKDYEAQWGFEHGRKVTRVAQPSFAYLMGLHVMSSDMDQFGTPLGIITGLSREITATIGTRAGIQIGQRLAFTLGKRFTLGGYLGKGVGGLVGGMLGYQALDILHTISRLGRAWTIPDIGGRLYDTAISQTMRARSLQAIRTSQFNVRNELGNEAFKYVTGMYLGM